MPISQIYMRMKQKKPPAIFEKTHFALKFVFSTRFAFWLACTAVALLVAWFHIWILKRMGFALRGMPALVEASHRLDVNWYLQIADQGYQIDPHRKDQSTAFFPLFPYFIKIFSNLFRLNLETGAFYLQLLLFCCASISLGEYWLRARKIHDDLSANLKTESTVSDKMNAIAFVFFFFCQPAFVFFVVPYTESIFVLMSIPIYLSLSKRTALKIPEALLLVFFGILAALTRPTGILFGAGALVGFLFARFLKVNAFRHLCLGVGIGVGIATLMSVQYFQVGDPMSFLNVRKAGWNETPGFHNLVNAFAVHLGGTETLRHFVLYLSLFAAYLCAKFQSKWISVICVSLILIPLYQGKFADIVRYVSICVPLWACLFQWLKTRPLRFAAVVFIFSQASLLYAQLFLLDKWVG